MTRIYGITYGNKQTEYIPFQNTFHLKAWRFEYNPMLHIVNNMVSDMAGNDLLGIVSWKFGQKSKLSKQQVMAICDAEDSKDTELINFSPDLGNPAGYACFMDWSAAGHGETLRYLIKECCRLLGWQYYNYPQHVVYANMFVARVGVYREYMHAVSRCIDFLESESMWWLVNTDAAYTAGNAKVELKRNLGLDFYNYLPFVLERMTMQFIANRNIKTVSV